MANLYEIAEEYKNAIDKLEIDENGEVTNPEILEQLRDHLNEKVESISLGIKGIETLVNGIKAEEKKLVERRRAKENKVKYLKEYIANAMLNAGEPNIETARCRVFFRNSESVVVKEVRQLPEQYQRVDTVVTANKPAIKNALKSGENIPGATLVQNQNLQIK